MEEKSKERKDFEDRVGLVLYVAFTVITIIALFCVEEPSPVSPCALFEKKLQ